MADTYNLSYQHLNKPLSMRVPLQQQEQERLLKSCCPAVCPWRSALGPRHVPEGPWHCLHPRAQCRWSPHLRIATSTFSVHASRPPSCTRQPCCHRCIGAGLGRSTCTHHIWSPEQDHEACMQEVCWSLTLARSTWTCTAVACHADMNQV